MNERHDHVWYTFKIGDEILTHTKVSRGREGDITAGIVSAMARQLGMPTQDFVAAVNCKLSATQFYQHLANFKPAHATSSR